MMIRKEIKNRMLAKIKAQYKQPALPDKIV
jgi:hypothetical protein